MHEAPRHENLDNLVVVFLVFTKENVCFSDLKKLLEGGGCFCLLFSRVTSFVCGF